MTIYVSADKLVIKEESAPTFYVDADHANASYSVGDAATFFVHLLTDVTGQETLVRARVDGHSIGVTKSSDLEFLSQTQAFLMSDVGEHTYVVNVFSRDKKWADSYRLAIQRATELRQEYIRQRNASQDETLQAYYQTKADDTTLLIQSYYDVLEQSLTQIGSGNFYFQVTASR